MKYAWLQDQVIRDICPGNPAESYHPDVAALYDTQVPDDAAPGDTFENGVLTPKPVPEYVAPEPVAPTPPKVSPVEFKLLFTSAERVAIKVARPTDPVLDDFFDIVDDPRLTHVDLALASVQGALHYLAAISLITDARREEIMLGVVQ